MQTTETLAWAAATLVLAAALACALFPAVRQRAAYHVMESILAVVRLGPIPKHIAFIMDGNRRFARRLNAKPTEGHRMGFRQLEKTLDWCMRLGIQVVTVYAFSIENFKRPEEEVSTLMDLAEAKFIEFASKSELVHKHGIAVRVLGCTEMLPSSVRKAACKAVIETRHNHRAILNICCPYTSQHEMLVAIQESVQGVRDGLIFAEDICEETIDQCLFTEDCPPLDILVRTSGETRLSDFMLWQCASDCLIYFLNRLWPEFSFWDMLPILLVYQGNYNRLESARKIRLDQSRSLLLEKQIHDDCVKLHQPIDAKNSQSDPSGNAPTDAVSTGSGAETMDGATAANASDTASNHSSGSVTPSSSIHESDLESPHDEQHRRRRHRLEAFYKHVRERRLAHAADLLAT